MKRIVLSFIFVFSLTSAWSQSLIDFSLKIWNLNFPNQYTSFVLYGYHTHFQSVDSVTISYASLTDTLSFKVKPSSYSTNDLLTFYDKIHIQKKGYYDLIVSNDSDGVMIMPKAVYADSLNYLSNVELSGNYYNLNTDTSITFNVYSGNGLDPNIYTSAFLISYTGEDTLFADSVQYISPHKMKFKIDIPDSISGLFHAFITNDKDSMMYCMNEIFVHNYNVTQIDSVSPDSISNFPFPGPINQKIYVYGNQTHFTSFDNKVYLNSWLSEFIDSVKVINDTLLTYNISLPIPVKQALIPSEYLFIYNPADGLLTYPIRMDFFGGINTEKAKFENIVLFPNPTDNKLNINLDEPIINQEILIEIYSPEGKIVKSLSAPAASNILVDVSPLSTGLYFIQISSNNQTAVLKFVKN